MAANVCMICWKWWYTAHWWCADLVGVVWVRASMTSWEVWGEDALNVWNGKPSLGMFEKNIMIIVNPAFMSYQFEQQTSSRLSVMSANQNLRLTSIMV